jgi:hypothetical protein
MMDSGEVFEVPSWPERLCGMLSESVSSGRHSYSEYLLPAYIGGLPAVIVAGKLSKDFPESCAIVKQFVVGNCLKTRPGRSGNVAGKQAIVKQARRELAHSFQQQERREFIKG